MKTNVVELEDAVDWHACAERRQLEDHIRGVGLMKELLWSLDFEGSITKDATIYAIMKLCEEIDALVRCHDKLQRLPPRRSA
jgi:hypothetical protein